MQSGLLPKISVWLVIIGVAALLAPNPAWPEWVSRTVLAIGLVLGLSTYATGRRKSKRNPPPKDDD